MRIQPVPGGFKVGSSKRVYPTKAQALAAKQAITRARWKKLR